MHRIILFLSPVLLALTGCGTEGKIPPETDPTKGREMLSLVLDTWARGGTPNDLKNSSPPIVVYDPDWEAGDKLVKYKIDPSDDRTGVDLLLTVTLTLNRTSGRTQEKTVNFTVAIGSQTVVMRKQ